MQKQAHDDICKLLDSGDHFSTFDVARAALASVGIKSTKSTK